MAVLTRDIKSRDWQLSTAGVGIVAEGLQDIRQCIDIILRTVKGTDPLRPQFGSDIFQYVDKPLDVAIPNMVKAIIEAIDIWEQRVEIQRVVHEEKISDINFFITYKLVDEELIDQLTLQIKGGFISVQEAELGSLILEAYFPDGYQSKHLSIVFTINGEPAVPLTYENGFATMADLFAWVQQNWVAYGKWFLANDRIVLYLNPGIAKSASLQILAVGIYKYFSGIPDAGFDHTYKVEFIPDSGLLLSVDGLLTIEEMLLYARSTWGNYGTWEIEPIGPLIAGEFDEGEFYEEEFLTGESGYALVLYSKTEKQASLAVSFT